MVTKVWLKFHAYISAELAVAMQNLTPQQPLLCDKYTFGFFYLITYEQFIITMIFDTFGHSYCFIDTLSLLLRASGCHSNKRLISTLYPIFFLLT